MSSAILVSRSCPDTQWTLGGQVGRPRVGHGWPEWHSTTRDDVSLDDVAIDGPCDSPPSVVLVQRTIGPDRHNNEDNAHYECPDELEQLVRRGHLDPPREEWQDEAHSTRAPAYGCRVQSEQTTPSKVDAHTRDTSPATSF